MTVIQVQLDDLSCKTRQLLQSYFGQVVGSLSISATFCEFEDAPWEIQVLTPSGDLHTFAGIDAGHALRNLERLGLGVIGGGLVNQQSTVWPA
jgi:hypothetical protein